MGKDNLERKIVMKHGCNYMMKGFRVFCGNGKTDKWTKCCENCKHIKTNICEECRAPMTKFEWNPKRFDKEEQ